MTKFQKSPVEKKRAPKPECKDVCAPRRRKPGTKPGGGPHDILIKAMGEEEARRRCQKLKLTAGGIVGRHDGPTAPPQRPLVHEGPAVKYPKRHLQHVQHSRSHSNSPLALVRRHQPRCAEERAPSATHSDGLAGPSSLPGTAYLGTGNPSTQDRSRPRPIVNTFGSIVPPPSSRHPPDIDRVHNHIKITDKFGAVQAAQLLPGCHSMQPCTWAVHVPIAASRPTTFKPRRHNFQTVANGQNSQAAANINLQDWHPQYGANSTSLQGRWPQDPTGPRYRTSSFVDEPPLQQTGANLEVYRGLEPAPMETGQPIPVAPDMLDVQVANNGLHNWQTWRRPVHPAVTPAQTFWSQDTIGEWYPHPKYEEEVPIHRASANFGPPPAAYQDFGGPATDPTIPYNSNTYQVCPTRKPVATVDEGSVTDSNVSPHEYWLWLVGGTSVECVEERRE